MTGRCIVTAEEMRAAEAAEIARGTPVEALMERAGLGAAEAIWRHAGNLPTLVICGPGNNGGDGYVIARALRDRGMSVRVAALGEPKSEAAQAAKQNWAGPVYTLQESDPAEVLVDALFGTGLTRRLDAPVSAHLSDLASAARVTVAVDLPSGVAADDGVILSPVPGFDLTITFAALKPSHLMQPAASRMGRLVVVDIGVQTDSRLKQIAAPLLRLPGPQDHKYSRGYVALLAGDMPGAAALAATAAARSGAGYVRLLSSAPVPGVAHSVVQANGDPVAALADPRIDALVVGPGLGRGASASRLLDAALASTSALVLDADALVLVAGRAAEALKGVARTPILTPHAGEFSRLFGTLAGSKVEQTRAAAVRAGSVIVYKGADTVVAAPDGRAAMAAPGSSWLATAGTGDVLTGIVAAMRASGLEAFEAACAGVWLHGRAAELAGPALIADDLLAQLQPAMAACL